MGKHKKKHSKKDSAADDLLDVTAVSIKKYRKVTNEIAKLSTGQKLVGGLMLLAAGYFYFDKLKQDSGGNSLAAALPLPLPWLPGGQPAARRPADEPAEDAEVVETPSKSRKAAKPAKHAGSFGKKSAAGPDDF